MASKFFAKWFFKSDLLNIFKVLAYSKNSKDSVVLNSNVSSQQTITLWFNDLNSFMWGKNCASPHWVDATLLVGQISTGIFN